VALADSFSLRGCCRRLLILGGLLLVFIGWPASIQAAPEEDLTPATVVPVRTYPDIEQLVPLSTILGVEVAEAKALLNKVANQKEFLDQSKETQETLVTVDQRLAGWGPVSQWSEGRLLGARLRLQAILKRHQEDLNQLVLPVTKLEEMEKVWIGKLAFWDGWQRSPGKGRGRVDQEQFARNRETIKELLAQATLTKATLSELQQRLAAQQDILVSWVTQIDTALAGLHGPIFERNAPSLLSSEFLGQFNLNLWAGLGADLASALSVPVDFAPRQGWVVILQLLLVLTIAWKLHQRSRQAEPVTEQWRFLFEHPLAGGVFVVLVGSSFLYVSPPLLLRWVTLVLGTVAATTLICSMLERPRLRRVIITLATLFICSTTIRVVGLVQPLHRLFLVVVGVIAVPLCLAAARRQRQRRGGQIDLLVLAFYLGTLAGTISLLAQFAGYYSLSAYLINTFLGTVFVYLFTRMAMLIGDGAIDAFLKAEWVRDRSFFQHLGDGVAPRLKILWHVIVVINAILYLLAQWQVYATASDAWQGLRALTFEIGELQISVEVILMTVFVLYLTFIISWLLQALLDTEVMSPRGMEHGVKFAIKTLVHYSLILVGFLAAISVAGVDMSKFAILAGALGVGIGFGLQNIVNNFLGGLILLLERPIKIGDTVSLDDQWGTITRIGLRSTVVETPDRAELIVPNSELIAQKVTNWTFTTNVSRIVIPVGVAYGSPLGKVAGILLKVAEEHGEVLADPPPSAIFTRFGDSSIDFELRVWINDIGHRLRIRSELGIAIDKSFRAAGVVIPFPQRDLHLQSVAPNLQAMVRPPAKGQPKSVKDSAE